MILKNKEFDDQQQNALPKLNPWSRIFVTTITAFKELPPT